MGILSIVLIVIFVIIAILLILLVLIQNEEGDSLGGIFAGGSSSAFGSRSGNVLTRATTVLGALFFIISLTLAVINRSPGGSGIEKAALEQETKDTTQSTWWDQNQNAPAVPDSQAAPESPANPETPTPDDSTTTTDQ